MSLIKTDVRTVSPRARGNWVVRVVAFSSEIFLAASESFQSWRAWVFLELVLALFIIGLVLAVKWTGALVRAFLMEKTRFSKGAETGTTALVPHARRGDLQQTNGDAWVMRDKRTGWFYWITRFR